MATDKPILKESDIWARTADPSDVIKPDQTKIDSGFLFAEKPPYHGHNYYWQLFSKYLVSLNQSGVPAWDSETTYQKGALAKDGDNVYMALVENSNVQPSTDPGVWGLTQLLGTEERGGVAWGYATLYYKDDISVDGGYAYIALKDNSNRQPSMSPDHWRRVVDISYYDDRYVNVTGDTMTGNLRIPHTPDYANSATSKKYVDEKIASLEQRIDALEAEFRAHGHTIGEITNLQYELDRCPKGSWSRSGDTLNIDIEGS